MTEFKEQFSQTIFEKMTQASSTDDLVFGVQMQTQTSFVQTEETVSFSDDFKYEAEPIQIEEFVQIPMEDAGTYSRYQPNACQQAALIEFLENQK